MFNDALNTFYILLYGVGHMIKNHSDRDRKPAAVTTWATLSDWGSERGGGEITIYMPIS